MANTSGTAHDDFDEAAPEQVVLTELSASIVVAYVSRNSVPAADMPSLIGTVHSALLDLRKPIVPKVETKQAPAVPIKRSVQDEQLTCLECGKSQISLKRHLGVAHGLVPSEYRAKWGLRPDYPMVAPGYSARRSALAKQLGLGRKPNAKGSPQAKDALATSNRKT
ncbi:MucR family transcriptional regulator [Aurantimonas coralicida]|uniref:MucR family transcriptional regulator n=1 Tax=Aurantimonas coralicida TaxID=182270 RepID=UPI001E4262A0|nr:MucR family transcriptional regulator [Aurantimonas coralicida]MCD1644952.1 MucR family transcriptional regulator [Aurantimonas coralicida]